MIKCLILDSLRTCIAPTTIAKRGVGTGREEKVPIKWMAPEGIETNVFDESTDVVSQMSHIITLVAIYNSLFMIIPRDTLR